MQSKTSYFNKTLFLKNLTRFWPIWAVYTAIWSLMLPIPMFISHMEELQYGASGYTRRLVERMLNSTGDVGVLLAFFFGLLAAMSVFSYLYNSRSAGLMHTLPIRREGLFLTNWLSGYCFLLLPHLFVALLTLLIQLSAGLVDLPAIGMWLLIQGGTCLFFYSFAVFCGMFTGHILALPAFYLIFNFLALVLNALFNQLISIFAFGYVGGDGISPLTEWLTPTIKLGGELYYRAVTENGVEVQLFTGFQYVLAYALTALVLTVAALLLYRVRHMETAGDVIAFSWAKPLFKYGFSFCAALCGGMLLYYLFSSLFRSRLLPLSLFTVLSGVVGCFVAEMLLQKSFKVFRRGWTSCGIFSLLLVVMMFGLSRDFFGLELRVPSPDSVQSLYTSTHNLAPYDSASYGSDEVTDPAVIANFIAIHQFIVDNRAQYQDSDGLSGDYDWQYFNFRYTMKDGRTLRRAYSIPVTRADASVINTLTLQAVNDPAYLLARYFPFDRYGATAVAGYLPVCNEQGDLVDVNLTAAQAEAVAAAARDDVEAGRLGIRYLEDSAERMSNCSYTDLELTWHYQFPSGQSSSGSRDVTSTVTITPQFTATRLMDTLTDLGILDQEHRLLSYQEYLDLTDQNIPTDAGLIPAETAQEAA